MSDDLVKRLRHLTCNAYDVEVIEKAKNAMEEAADRIEQLEAALSQIYAWYPISVAQPRQTIDDIRDFARVALEGEKDE